MSHQIKLDRDPYGEGTIYKRRKITLEPGVTVLVGCNGLGKTTLLKEIEEHCHEADIPCIFYNNLKEGNSHAVSGAFFRQDYTLGATLMFSSEGERIVINLSQYVRRIGDFIRRNKDSKKIFVLLDAIDSGLSIDNVCDIKDYLFAKILETEKDREVYIIVSANEYELCRGEKCLDVYSGAYKQFRSYDAYRKYILKTREIKNARYQEDETKKE